MSERVRYVGNVAVLCQVSNHLTRAFDDPETLIDSCRVGLRGIDFDTIVGTGFSGALVVPPVARSLGKHFALVRRDDETLLSPDRGGAHSDYYVEGNIGRHWVFVDDQFCSYRTVAYVMKHMNALNHTTFVGAYGYLLDGWQPYLTVIENLRDTEGLR